MATCFVIFVLTGATRVYLSPWLAYEVMVWLKEKEEDDLFKYWLFGCTGMAFFNLTMVWEYYKRFQKYAVMLTIGMREEDFMYDDEAEAMR